MGANLQSLPAELIQLILQHSLPLPSYSAFPTRYSLLLSYSLVCKQWTPLAQHLLYSQLHFPSPLEVDSYLTATCAYDEATKTWGPTPRGVNLADLAKGVWFGGGKAGRISGVGETERMMNVLVLLVNLRVVWARDMMPFALERLSGLSGLSVERLHLDRIKMITPYAGTPRLLLPSVQHLHLSASCLGLVDLATGALHSHSPSAYLAAAFPPLASITLDRSFQFEPSGDVAPIQLPASGSEAAVRALRIDAALVTEEGEPVTDWLRVLPLCTSLERLALSDPGNLLDLAEVLPARRVSTLEVLLPQALAGPNAAVDEINYDLKIMSALLGEGEGLKGLRRLVVSACVDERGARVGDGRARAGLRGRCEGLGVELVERAFGPEGDRGRWEWVGLEES